MSTPIVAIVGRPNVGKSTLFNKLIGERLSIVDDTPGVTRDRIYGECEWNNRKIRIIDTGGIEPYSDDVILKQMRRQAELAIDTADVTVLVTDVRDGVVATDEEVEQYKGEEGTESLKDMGAYFLTSTKPMTRALSGTVKVKAKKGDETVNYVEMSYREAKKFVKEMQEKAEKEAEESQSGDEAEGDAGEAETEAED